MSFDELVEKLLKNEVRNQTVKSYQTALSKLFVRIKQYERTFSTVFSYI